MGNLFSAFIQSFSFFVKNPTNQVDFEAESWPVTDEEGYYQSYKENGKFVNWWHKDMPSFVQILDGWDIKGLFGTFGNSSDFERELEQNLPIQNPYWIQNPEVVGKEGIRATWIGHSTVLAEIDGLVVLTDPIFSDRCFPLQWAGPKRYRPPACSIHVLPDVIHAVMISHTHYDHLDYNSVVLLHKKYGNNLHWYVPSGSRLWFEETGILSDTIHDMVWWQSEEIHILNNQKDQNLDENCAKIIYTPANHHSRRTLFDYQKSLWGSWVVIGSNGSKFWFGGDTAYSDVFKQIGKRYGPFDLSAIPIGAYSPRKTMKYDHVDPLEAVLIHQDLNSKFSFGIHWGTFKLTLESYMEPKMKLLELVESQPNLPTFAVLNIGETAE